MGSGIAGGAPPRTTTSGSKNKEQYRYEFVVMLVWREPVTPITLEPAAAAPSNSTSPFGTGGGSKD
jgi:hypothetical protein